jgi:hypothetical protein
VAESPAQRPIPALRRTSGTSLLPTCQGEGRGFESRRPLQRNRGSGPVRAGLRIARASSRVPGVPSGSRLVHHFVTEEGPSLRRLADPRGAVSLGAKWRTGRSRHRRSCKGLAWKQRCLRPEPQLGSPSSSSCNVCICNVGAIPRPRSICSFPANARLSGFDLHRSVWRSNSSGFSTTRPQIQASCTYRTNRVQRQAR